MDIEDDPEINLHIPLKPVYEEFVCPICFSTIEECMTTPCGHSFCGECIKECLNRKHQCPCCNHPTTAKELFKNLHADRLVSIMTIEKDKASKAYFDNLLNSGGKVGGGGGGASGGGGGGGSALNASNALSPIEQVFHQYMKKSLLSYEEYHKSLRQKFERGLEAAKSEFTAKMMKAKDEHKGAAAETLIEELKTQFEARRTSMEESFARTEEMIVKQYEAYLKDIVVTPQFLPIQVVITVSKREGIKIPYVVKPTDTPKDLKEAVRLHFEKIGDPIKEFGSKNYFMLKRPYAAGKGKQKANEDAMDVDDVAEASEDVKIKDDDAIVLTFRPEPGSTLCLRGKLQMKSEEPKKCFKQTYDAKNVDPVDYFTCKTCKSNWICKTCADSCHAGHEIVVYLKQHKPTWACCYCYKTNCCKLYQK